MTSGDVLFRDCMEERLSDEGAVDDVLGKENVLSILSRPIGEGSGEEGAHLPFTLKVERRLEKR